MLCRAPSCCAAVGTASDAAVNRLGLACCAPRASTSARCRPSRSLSAAALAAAAASPLRQRSSAAASSAAWAVCTCRIALHTCRIFTPYGVMVTRIDALWIHCLPQRQRSSPRPAQRALHLQGVQKYLRLHVLSHETASECNHACVIPWIRRPAGTAAALPHPPNTAPGPPSAVQPPSHLLPAAALQCPQLPRRPTAASPAVPIVQIDRGMLEET